MHSTMALPRQLRHAGILALISVVAALFLAAPASAAGNTGQKTVFWGRNKDEGSLREACDSGWYTMVTMSFLDVFGHGNKYHLDLSGHDLSAIGGEIKHCQSIGGLVSLSIAGYGTGYSLPSNRSALDLFEHLWNSYFGGSMPGVPRPFGDAWLDGVDMFLEHGTPDDRYDVLALELAKHNIRGGPGKPRHLTATVRCAYPLVPPSAHVGRAVATGIFERVHMRIYEEDDKCNVYGPWETSWNNWTAAYPATRFYIGLTADMNSHQWIEYKNIYYWIGPLVEKKDNYGGFMLWDRYFDKQSG